MHDADLQGFLQARGVEADVKINNNFRTYLSVQRYNRRGSVLRLSLHKIFLSAPDNVLEALIAFIRGDREARKVIRDYVALSRKGLDYSSLVDKETLITKGKAFDLSEIFNELNARYFGGTVDASITYFGKDKRHKGRTHTLGTYCSTRKLIKIHAMLDSATVPKHVIEYVVYHEMLHAVIPEIKGATGQVRVHHRVFKQQEKLFHQFAPAKQWLKKIYS
jgi:hypothetical protein